MYPGSLNSYQRISFLTLLLSMINIIIIIIIII